MSNNLKDAQAAVVNATPQRIQNALENMTQARIAIDGDKFTMDQFLGFFAVAVRCADN